MNPQSSVSRRVFLVGSAGGLLAAATAQSYASAAASSSTKPQTKMRFGFTTYQWGQDWDIPTLIANCQKAGALGVELRTSASYAHGVEVTIDAKRRREVKKQFADSPVTLVSIASGERFDSPLPEKLNAAIKAAKAHVQLSHDVGASCVRVFPNDFHKDVPHERTIGQIAAALTTVGAFAAGLGQLVELEAHGSAGELTTLRAIMDQVKHPSVRVKLNSDRRDTLGKGFEQNFNLVKPFLGKTLHFHDLKDAQFPNQVQVRLLQQMDWDGWFLLESSAKVADRVAAIKEQRDLWEGMLANVLKS